MKRIIKILNYAIIAILIPAFVLSLAYMFYAENKTDENMEHVFVSTFMQELGRYADLLIHNHSNYTMMQDEDFTIFYADDMHYSRIEDMKLYIKYKNKVITNLELTEETSSFDKIKSIIENENNKKTSIVNGKVVSDTLSIKQEAVEHFYDFNIQYYSIDGVIDEDYEYDYYTNEVITNINDFEIYSSYNEKIIESSFEQFLGKLEPYENLIYICIPVSILLIIVCLTELVYIVGHENGSKDISLNGLDRIYYEIIFLIYCMVASIPLGLTFEIFDYYLMDLTISQSLSLISTVYIVIYIVSAILFNTTLKRIKAKQFLKTSVIGKCILLIWKYLKKAFKEVYDMVSDLKNSLPKTKQKIAIICLILILLPLIFNGFGIFLDVIIIALIIHKILKIVKSYEQIELKLQDMYEGNNDVVLLEDDVEKEFKNSIKYINDISNGFENAIQESMKSERLKTELITNVSHDIKTPLTSIINYVDLLKQEEINNEKAKEYIEILENKSYRLKKLTEDLVEASKASSGNIKLNIEKIDIVELLKQSIGEFEDKFTGNGLEIITNYSKENIYINADSRYLYRVVENMFSNIAKYALENSRVYIDIFEEGKKVSIIIKNISKNKLNISPDELMQRFVRGDKSRTTEGSGLRNFYCKEFDRVTKRKI